jgi:glycosyltransferase involved in cell wall biosynthesis
MKVLFISPSFHPATYYGGPIPINYAFCNSLAKTEHLQLKVLTTDADGPSKRIAVQSIPETLKEGYEVYYCRRAFRPDISPRLLRRLFGMIREADIVHLNAVYSFTTLPTLALCRLLKRPVVWSPLGALQRWPGTTRKTTKRLWERICNSFCNPERVVLHVTSEEEKSESLGRINRASSVVIRNGIDIPELTGDKDSRRDSSLRLLYMGRLHPIKGIENLLQALMMVKINVKLSICGEGESDYQMRLQSMVTALELSDRVQFHGRVDGEVKELHFRNADLCIVPSFKESFCTVVVESLARGVPVIASHGTPWQRIEDMNCGLWVANGPKELSKAIDQAANMPLREMGLRGRQLMEQEYSWSGVVEEMIAQYRSLIANNEVRRQGTERHPSRSMTPESND